MPHILDYDFHPVITVEVTFQNGSSISWHRFIGDKGWDGGDWTGRYHDASMQSLAESLFDQCEEEIVNQAESITLRELAGIDRGDYIPLFEESLILAERAEDGGAGCPFEVCISAMLDLVE